MRVSFCAVVLLVNLASSHGLHPGYFYVFEPNRIQIIDPWFLETIEVHNVVATQWSPPHLDGDILTTYGIAPNSVQFVTLNIKDKSIFKTWSVPESTDLRRSKTSRIAESEDWIALANDPLNIIDKDSNEVHGIFDDIKNVQQIIWVSQNECEDCIAGFPRDSCPDPDHCGDASMSCINCDRDENDPMRRCPYPNHCDACDGCGDDCPSYCLADGRCEDCIAGLPKISCPYPELCGFPSCVDCREGEPTEYCPFPETEICGNCVVNPSLPECQQTCDDCMARPRISCPFPELCAEEPPMCFACESHPHVALFNEETCPDITKCDKCIDCDDGGHDCPVPEDCEPICYTCAEGQSRFCPIAELCEDGDPGDGHDGHEMMMYFHFGTHETILFGFWTTTTIADMIASICVIAAISMMREWLVIYRQVSMTHFRQKHDLDGINYVSMYGKKYTVRLKYFMTTRDSILYFFNLGLGYSLMLIVMTSNVTLCLAILIFSALGNYLFARPEIEKVDRADHCA